LSQEAIKIESLKKYYSNRLVLDIPHLQFQKGGIYALVGPNGAGKTTLLRIINLLETADEGYLYFYGTKASLSNALGFRRHMTFVMQYPVLFHTSVYKNIAYGLRVRSYNKEAISGMVSEALDIVGLSGFESRKARNLSSGETQRVALARALILNPELLLLDEPTTNIDRRNSQILESVLKDVNNKQGTTIIFTTHDLSQAYRMTDKVIFLDGKIIGSNPENIFYGKFEREIDGSMSIHITPSVKIRVDDCQDEASGIYIDPKDISISSYPMESEQSNCLKGKIISITSDGDLFRLTVNAGIELIALQSKDNIQNLDMGIFDQPVYLVFKKSCVKIF